MKVVLTIIYLILSISGLILMKLGGNSGAFSLDNGGTIGFSIHWLSLIGLCCYLFSFLLFTRLVIIFDLSYIMPVCTGIVQVATLIASKFVFKESITVQGLVGACIIIIGIIIMNIPKSLINA